MSDADLVTSFANQSLSCAQFMTEAQMQNPRLFPCDEDWLAIKPWVIADKLTTREIRTNVINAKTLITLLTNTNAKLVTLRAKPETLVNTSMIMAQDNIKTAVEQKLMEAFGFIPTLEQYNAPVNRKPPPVVVPEAAANSDSETAEKAKSNNIMYVIMAIIAAVFIMFVSSSSKKNNSPQVREEEGADYAPQ